MNRFITHLLLLSFAVTGSVYSTGAFAAESGSKRPERGANATKKKQTPTQQKPPPQVREEIPANLHPVAEHAQKIGAKRCLVKLDQFSRFVTTNADSNAYLFLPDKEPDSRMISSSFEIVGSETTAFASVTAAPRWNGCGAVYEATVYWPQPCSTVAQARFSELSNIGILKQGITVLGDQGSMRVFLMPAGEGCVSIKKEVSS